ncbi:sensor histidine kinase [Maribacter hydrothermalis]|uniref:sensor histidine kinase n=1 Tax=Maribacter hydrothermalis TaxID=1836467 RepID=UPI0009EEF01C|nr:HAMP domain-containing sensor histidine kinase [Maribacter hydrothermalis]
MKKRNIYITIFLVSIIGLAIVQYQYLRIGLSLAKVQFNTQLGEVSKEIADGLETKNQLTFLIVSALKEDTSYFNDSVGSVQDASKYFLNDFLTEKLVRAGIETEFTYTLQTKDSLYYLQSANRFDEDEEMVSYPIELSGYLPKEFGAKVVLQMQFKNLNTYFLAKLNGLTVPSLLFIMGICIAVIWVLRTYYWQQNVITTTNEFINNLTHELKTPVFSIGLATKILEDKANENQVPLLKIIKQQVNRLTVQIEKVLELGSLESNFNVLKLNNVDFKPYVEKICHEFKTLVSMEKVQFSYHLETGNYTIKAEVFHLENALNNILDNAKKYAKDPVITLSAYVENRKLSIKICDNGSGIDSEDQDKIFLKYFRVKNMENEAVEGYGLGLSYVKKVVEKHHGKVVVESEKGVGTSVLIRIPLCHE